MNDEKVKIHIAVACHKPSRLPQNALLVPVQVNAARAKNRLQMAHDDEGDNISEKNPEYCELTAQYWEWKNVEADYYGLCHYRRFLCFTVPEDAAYNERHQIEAEAIDDYNLSRFGLEDEARMREVIEANDVVTGSRQNVPGLFTPRGNQLTAYKHWTAHHRALIMTEDLEKMLDILDEVSPEVGKDTREYLQGKEFTGFNCFVMRKALFRELCEIEFAVLERLEQQVDLSNYCTQLSRIYGFMGEIISSGFLYHLKKRNYKVEHVPLVYFNSTDREREKTGVVPGEIPVCFYPHLDRPEMFAVTWQSFLESRNPDNKYKVFICHEDMCKVIQETLLSMAEAADNITVEFLNGASLRKSFAERLHTDAYLPMMLFLPYVLEEYSEMLFLTDRILIQSPLDELWEEELEEGRIIAAPFDTYMLGRVNDIFPETAYDYMREQLENPYEYYSVSAIKIDLAACREKYRPEQLLLYCFNTQHQIRDNAEALNAAFEHCFQKTDQKWCVWYDSCWALEYALPFAPRDNYQEMVRARKAPGVITYLVNDPFEGTFTELNPIYWALAEKTPMYQFCLAHSTEFLIGARSRPRPFLNNTFKKGSKSRAVLSHLFPKGTARRRMMAKVLLLFNLE